VPLEDYGVLVGRVVDRRRERGRDSPHYQLHVVADQPDGAVDYRVAVNVLSQQAPSELLFAARDDLTGPLLDVVGELPDGFAPLESRSDSGAVDYVRGGLIERDAMQPLPPDLPGPGNDLADRLESLVERARADDDARVFAYGQRWGPEPGTADEVFGFEPGNGVHDIHMNQGNSPKFAGDDGVWQDGGLLLHLPAEPRWVGIFLAFQSQAWHTDDATGHAIPGTEPVPGGGAPAPAAPVRIVAAMVNPAGPAPEHESVLLLNASPDAIDLTGWRIADRAKRTSAVPGGPLGAGATLAVALPGDGAQLSNDGGTITLLDAGGLKADGVAYTAAQAGREGWTLVF
jgi:uncharacterized protein YukJ